MLGGEDDFVVFVFGLRICLHVDKSYHSCLNLNLNLGVGLGRRFVMRLWRNV